MKKVYLFVIIFIFTACSNEYSETSFAITEDIDMSVYIMNDYSNWDNFDAFAEIYTVTDAEILLHHANPIYIVYIYDDLANCVYRELPDATLETTSLSNDERYRFSLKEAMSDFQPQDCMDYYIDIRVVFEVESTGESVDYLSEKFKISF